MISSKNSPLLWSFLKSGSILEQWKKNWTILLRPRNVRKKIENLFYLPHPIEWKNRNGASESKMLVVILEWR